MNTNRAQKRARVWFFVALFTCISAAAGVVLIPLCAVAKLWLPMGIGVALCLHGFYGAVFYWLAFAENKKYASLTDAVTKDALTTVSELSAHFGWKEGETVTLIRNCLHKGLLPGYRFDGEKLVKIEIKRDEYAVECPYCGAKNLISGEIVRCAYCGSPLKKPNGE